MTQRSDSIVRAALVASFALVATACGDDFRDTPCGAVSCDIGTASCQRAVFEATACLSGDPADTMPEVREMTRAEFREYLAAQADDGGEIGPFDAAFQLMGLVPGGRSLSDAWSDEEAVGVAAFYEFDSRSITLITDAVSDGIDRVEAVYVLSHEFVHALQDRRIGADAFWDYEAATFDSDLARVSIVEGEASLHATRYLTEGLGYLIDWTALSASGRDWFLDSVQPSSPLVSAAFYLPYSVGTDYLHTVWEAEGFGGIDTVFRSPSTSVLDLMLGTFPAEDSRVEALDCIPTTGPPGYALVGSTSLGPTGVFAHLVANGLAPRFAWDLGKEWRADRLVVFESEDGDIAAAWRIRFRGERSADDVVGMTESASVAPVRSEREVLLLYADAPAAVWNDQPWDGAEGCGEAADLPVSKAARTGRGWIGTRLP